MSQRIRIGNTYEHDEWGTVVVTHIDHSNTVWCRHVRGMDNGGVISTSDDMNSESYKDFLGRVSMRDYPDNWDDIRTAILERDNYQCTCGAEDRELHVHHIVPLGAGGTNQKSNLITLCDECHGKVHGGVT